MLDIKDSLVFPKLRFIDKVELRRNSDEDKRKPPKIVPLYSLDWEYKEQVCKDRHIKWNLECWPNLKIPFMPDLPAEYDSYVKSLTFAVPHNYKAEIGRNARRGLEEWNFTRDFDTTVRENCLEPGIEHIYVAFYLLSDCIYDNSTKYYDRNPSNIISRYCLPYKFWSHQTGRGVRRQHAKIHVLESIAENPRMADDKTIKKFLASLDDYEKSFDAAYLSIYDGIGKQMEKDASK